MAKNYNVIDITSRSPKPLHTGLSREAWDRWFSCNAERLLHWAVMRNDRDCRDIVIVMRPGLRPLGSETAGSD